jgi:hypothetical protein
MAVYECDYGRHRYPQPQQSIYYTLALPSSSTTYACRLCPRHFRDSTVIISEKMAMVDEESKASATCDMCSSDKHQVIYAKVFPKDAESEYYVADLCAEHGSQLGNEVRMFNGRVM